MADRNGYIGRAPSDSSVVVARQTFSPTGITTDFTFASGYTVGYLDVYLNGAKQIEGQDYNANDSSTFEVLGGGAANGDVIEAVAYKAFNVSNIKDAPGDFTVGNNLTVVGHTTAVTAHYTGVVTASSFIGNGSQLTGVAGGKFSANATGINTTTSVGIGTTNATGAADSNNTAVLNVGVVTANSFFGDGSGLTGVANTENVIGTAITMTTGNITGNLTVGGVLTYDDVTNVDSIGIITARSDVSIADKIIHTGDTNTAIRFPATDTFTVETSGSERVRIDPNGKFLVGTTETSSNQSGALNVFGTDGTTSFVSIRRGSNNVSGPRLALCKSRNTTDGSNTIVQDDDILGTIHFYGNDGAGFEEGAAIAAVVDGTPGSDDLPTSLTFSTTPDGSNTKAERLRITSTGEVRVGSAFSVGQAGIVTAAEYHGDGSNLTGLSVGISTAAATVAGIVTTLDLSSAQDHKITVSGISTVTVKGGTEGDSHTVRIINSGITTVGFSTFFLFPSGADPSMPTADGAISLISFTVNRVGAGGTQLLAGAALNYS